MPSRLDTNEPTDEPRVSEYEGKNDEVSSDDVSAPTSPSSACQISGRGLLKEFQYRPGNYICGDCAGNETSWVSKDWGILLCQRCAGIHRGLGTHISKVRSIDLDDWTIEAAEEFMSKGGNDIVNEVLEERVHKISPIVNTELLTNFIQTKYKHKFDKKKWAVNERAMIYSNSKDGWYSGVISKVNNRKITCVFLLDNTQGSWDCCTKTLSDSSKDAKFVWPSDFWEVGATIGIFIRSRKQWQRGKVQKYNNVEYYYDVKLKIENDTITKRLPRNSYFLRHETGTNEHSLSFRSRVKKGWSKRVKKYRSKLTYTMKNPLSRGSNVISQEDAELCFKVLTQWIEAEHLFAVKPEKLAKIIRQYHGTDKWMKPAMRRKINDKISKYTL